MPMKQAHTLDVPGARLHYQVRGQGPALLLIPGSNGDADLFDTVAELLAPRYTVISYDRRGFSRSTLNGSFEDDAWGETHVNDARCLLQTVAKGPAHVFGSSAGAVIGLALISQSPGLVTGLIAHEPPLAEVLTDAARWRTFFQQVYDTYRRDGAGPAMQMFMTGIGLDSLQRPADIDPDLIRRLSGNLGFFLDHEVRQAPGHRPDLATLDAQQERIVMAGGRDSRQHFPYRAGLALADRWGKSMIDFPGDHTGYWSDPAGFATTLINVLDGPRT
ncbi:alpha/beta hydrolase [Nonomuraea sp. NPDC049784]|uniref:alpha/beta fold hydrolase n=1 Tax=Nonomuraea sp. NPDC049784 TaxID=3154361 RepID=UPI003400089A